MTAGYHLAWYPVHPALLAIWEALLTLPLTTWPEVGGDTRGWRIAPSLGRLHVRVMLSAGLTVSFRWRGRDYSSTRRVADLVLDAR